VLESIAGHDPRDSTSLQVPVPAFSQSINRPLAHLRIGWVREHFGPGLDSDVEKAIREALDVYKSLGATLHEISLPHSKYAVATYYVIAPSEASSNLARYDGAHLGYRTNEKEMLAELAAERKQLEDRGDKAALNDMDSALVRMYRRSRAEGFGPEVKRRIMLGTYALSAGYYDAYYLKALKVRRLIRRDFDEAFEKVDLIAGPITPAPAFKIGEMSGDPLAMYLVDIYTVSANLAGIPGLCLPCGKSKAGLPIGLQLQAPALEEYRLLRGARMFEQATGWHNQRAPLK
jgi:aspartyl-tRNA(Asn)/glutamyl-tRNA(Gln) amidotransferase subunit A